MIEGIIHNIFSEYPALGTKQRNRFDCSLSTSYPHDVNIIDTFPNVIHNLASQLLMQMG